ncbi:glyoxalase [Psychrosphaera saromensis]|uniref:Glyoxalase n=2 Tax=Psychrosphaera saromensis TaxID=716813 RepID=A0A2S7UTK2_9GAMM|nr:glyoxalase [Psychrosphaera saromensis]
MLTKGFNHVGLTVSDLTASSEFFIKTLGWKKVGEDTNYPAVFVSDGAMLLTLWQTSDAKTTVKFSRKNNVGLHHLAFSAASFEALDEIYHRVKGVKGVVVEFAPELAYGGPAKHMMIREPSGNRLEFMFRP